MTTLNETPPRLAPLEAAARLYCAKAGINPDERIDAHHPLIRGATVSEPAWHREAERLLDLAMMLSSMREVATAPTVLVS